jgi:hypothetical protein
MHPVNSQIGICGFYQAQEEQPEPSPSTYLEDSSLDFAGFRATNND